MMEKRLPIVVANWKMNGDDALLAEFVARDFASIAVDSAFALPTVLLGKEEAKKLPALAAQDVSAHEKGAYTGEIAARMLKEAGCAYCIVGHSERRAYHGEQETVLVEKIKQLKAQGIVPIYCVGESLSAYENGETQAVLEAQLQALFDAQVVDGEIIIAYEPVWAIGTGKAATAEYAQAVHQQIRAKILENCGSIARDIRLLYGGSVKADNARLLAEQADIDGFLVGGASLDADAFAKIIEAFLC